MTSPVLCPFCELPRSPDGGECRFCKAVGERARKAELSFRIKPGIYLIGSLERGLTVYKQQVRAHNLVWALWELQRRGEIDVGNKVATVGGGIAGLTAAACFLSRFGDTTSLTLFERRWDLCPFQQGSDHRWLHPRIYDWPKYGSRAPGASLPVLNWTEGRASDVARTIINEFSRFTESFCNSEGQLTIHRGVKNLSVRAATNEIEWTPTPTRSTTEPLGVEEHTSQKIQFDVIVLAPGFGLERSLDVSATPSYWRNDQLGQPILTGSRKKFIVSGFGDGALIDLCRLTVQRYRQDTILYELFPSGVEQAEQQLEAAWLAAGEPANLFAFFISIESTLLAQAKDELRARIRQDTDVILHIAGERGDVKSISDIFGPKSSFQNRMMTFLLFQCEAFLPTTDSLESVTKSHNVENANVLCRYGTDALSHLTNLFTDVKEVEQRLKEMKERQEQTSKLCWEPGSFPQYSKKGK